MHTTRHQQIAEQIQKELALLIPLAVQDPRIGLITITAVDLSPDYAFAKVFFTKYSDQEQVNKAIAGLNHAASFLRAQLARRMALRTMPRLTFVYDASVERGARLSRLIDDALASDADLHKDQSKV